MNTINLIMPMGGQGSRFAKAGYSLPKPLIILKDKPFFYWATNSILSHVDVCQLIFVVQQEHCKKFNLDNEILKFFPYAKFVYLPRVLNGALLSGLEGLKLVNNNYPVVFNDCDHLFLCKEFYKFCLATYSKVSQVDGALLTFKSNSPKYSYIKKDKDGNVRFTVEKQVVSNEAICGAYYFKNSHIILDNWKKYIQNCKYNEYYFSGLYNELISNGAIVKNFNVDMHLSFGTPSEYKVATKSQLFDVWGLK